MGDNGVHSPCTTQVMSEEQLKAFLDAVKADEELQCQLKAATDHDAVVSIAKTAGFVITADDVIRAHEEISEDELEGIGGAGEVEVFPSKPMTIQLRKGFDYCFVG